MIEAKYFIDSCYQLGYRLITGTPCSYMTSFFDYIAGGKLLKYIAAPNEGDAVAFATGATLAGQKTIVVFQNSGLGNAVNPLTSLSHVFKCPFIGIVSLRGDPNGEPDEVQHKLMGSITTSLLETMDIAWQYLPYDQHELEASLNKADEFISKYKKPFFFVLRKNTVKKYNNTYTQHVLGKNDRAKKVQNTALPSSTLLSTRFEVLNTITQSIQKGDVIISTTGKTSRELFTIGDKPNQFYMVGSMGCALPIGLGIAATNYKHHIFVLDGDGALLMRMGNLAFAGQQQCSNIVHILLDNGVHDSTGGQDTYSGMIDFCAIAQACGYSKIYSVNTTSQLQTIINGLDSANGMTFIRIKIKPGSLEKLGRPNVSPEDMMARFKQYIQQNR